MCSKPVHALHYLLTIYNHTTKDLQILFQGTEPRSVVPAKRSIVVRRCPSSSTWGHDVVTSTHADFDSLHLSTLIPCKMTDVHHKKLVDGLVRYKALRRTVSVCFLTVAASGKTQPTLILPSAAVIANGKLIDSSCPRDHDTSRKYVKTHSRWVGNIRDLLRRTKWFTYRRESRVKSH